MTALTPTVCTRISRAANALAHSGIEAADFFQIAAVKILEVQSGNPDFQNQTPAYIAQRGIWEARETASAEAVYGQHIVNLIEENDQDDEDEAGYTFRDIEAETPGPEELAIQEEMIRAITKALETLPPTVTTVVKMLYLGYGETEIARTLGITTGAVTQKRNSLRAILKRIL